MAIDDGHDEIRGADMREAIESTEVTARDTDFAAACFRGMLLQGQQRGVAIENWMQRGPEQVSRRRQQFQSLYGSDVAKVIGVSRAEDVNIPPGVTSNYLDNLFEYLLECEKEGFGVILPIKESYGFSYAIVDVISDDRTLDIAHWTMDGNRLMITDVTQQRLSSILNPTAPLILFPINPEDTRKPPPLPHVTATTQIQVEQTTTLGRIQNTGVIGTPPPPLPALGSPLALYGLSEEQDANAERKDPAGEDTPPQPPHSAEEEKILRRVAESRRAKKRAQGASTHTEGGHHAIGLISTEEALRVIDTMDFQAIWHLVNNGAQRNTQVTERGATVWNLLQRMAGTVEDAGDREKMLEINDICKALTPENPVLFPKLEEEEAEHKKRKHGKEQQRIQQTGHQTAQHTSPQHSYPLREEERSIYRPLDRLIYATRNTIRTLIARTLKGFQALSFERGPDSQARWQPNENDFARCKTKIFAGERFHPVVFLSWLLSCEFTIEQMEDLVSPPEGRNVLCYLLKERDAPALDTVLRRYPDLVKVLDNTTRPTPLAVAIMEEVNPKAVRKLLQRGAKTDGIATVGEKKVSAQELIEHVQRNITANKADKLNATVSGLRLRAERIEQLLRTNITPASSRIVRQDAMTMISSAGPENRPDLKKAATTLRRMNPNHLHLLCDAQGKHIVFYAIDEYATTDGQALLETLLGTPWGRMTWDLEVMDHDTIPGVGCMLNPWGYALAHGSVEVIEYIQGKNPNRETCGDTGIMDRSNRVPRLRTGTLLAKLIPTAEGEKKDRLIGIFLDLPSFITPPEQDALNMLACRWFTFVNEQPNEIILNALDRGDPFWSYRNCIPGEQGRLQRSGIYVLMVPANSEEVFDRLDKWVTEGRVPEPWLIDLLENTTLNEDYDFLDTILKHPWWTDLPLTDKILKHLAGRIEQNPENEEIWKPYARLQECGALQQNNHPLPTRKQIEALLKLRKPENILTRAKMTPKHVRHIFFPEEERKGEKERMSETDCLIAMLPFERSGFRFEEATMSAIENLWSEFASHPIGSRKRSLLMEIVSTHALESLLVLLQNGKDERVHTGNTGIVSKILGSNTAVGLVRHEIKSLKSWQQDERRVLEDMLTNITQYEKTGHAKPARPIELDKEIITTVDETLLWEVIRAQIQRRSNDALTFCAFWDMFADYKQQKGLVFTEDRIKSVNYRGGRNILQELILDRGPDPSRDGTLLRVLIEILEHHNGLVNHHWENGFSILGWAVARLDVEVVRLLVTRLGADRETPLDINAKPKNSLLPTRTRGGKHTKTKEEHIEELKNSFGSDAPEQGKISAIAGILGIKPAKEEGR